MEKHSCATLHNVAQIKTLHCLVSFKRDKVGRSVCVCSRCLFSQLFHLPTQQRASDAKVQTLKLSHWIPLSTMSWPKHTLLSDWKPQKQCLLLMLVFSQIVSFLWFKCKSTNSTGNEPHMVTRKGNVSSGFLTSQLITCHTLLQLDCTHQILAIFLVYQIAYKPQVVTPAQAHAVQTHTCLLMSKWSARRKENKPCLLKKCRTLMCFSMCRTLMRSWTVTYYPYISRTTQLTHLKWTHMHHVSM